MVHRHSDDIGMLSKRPAHPKEVRANMGQYGFRENSERIDDPAYLQGIYDAIKKEIFVRENLNH